MKKLMMTTAAFALLGTAVSAQDMFRGEADPNEIYASDFIGMRVYTAEAAIENDAFEGVQQDWEDIGEINDVILSRDGGVEAVLVDIGGFLGMGERQVAVDMDAIRFVSDSSTADNEGDFFLVMNAARSNFEEAPEYMPNRAAMPADDAVATDATRPAADAQGDQTAADTTLPADDAQADQTAADTTLPADGAMQSDQAAATDAERPMGEDAATEQAQADGEVQMDGTAGDTTVVQTAPGALPGEGTDTARTDGMDREPFVREGYQTAASADLNTDMLTGAPVYDAQDEWIGEVGELLVNEQGQITDAVIDIGGFLGIGEKPVRLALDEVDILRQTEGDEVRIYVSMTEEELEAMPSYEE